MRLLSLHLVNFRQHADTHILLGTGLTGIMGPNGAGKSTLLEAIAWALYGNTAARGTKDGIRRLGAEDARARVCVDLQFELAGHRYRVVRTLNSADCFLDDAAEPVATTVTGVSEYLQRRLGMTRTEFFNTYFTGQKELDVMRALSGPDRARFLSRVLGYDRLAMAQQYIRERKRTLAAEANGLRHGMADPGTVERAVRDAEKLVEAADARATDTLRAYAMAADRLEELIPRWREVQSERERLLQLQAERRVVGSELQACDRDVERLVGEIEAMEQARHAMASLRAEADTLQPAREELGAMERLAQAEGRRKALIERVQQLTAEDLQHAERAAKLERAPALEAETLGRVEALREQLNETDRLFETQRIELVRDRQEATTRLAALRTQYGELDAQRVILERLGAESACPTCGRPLGESYQNVLASVHEQLEAVQTDGNYYRQRVAQLSAKPGSTDGVEAASAALKVELQAYEQRLQQIRAAIAAAETIAPLRTRIAERLADADRELGGLPVGFDEMQFAALRRDALRLQEVENGMAHINGMLIREPEIRTQLSLAQLRRSELYGKLGEIDVRIGTNASAVDAYEVLRSEHDEADVLVRSVEIEAVEARAALARERAVLANAEQAWGALARHQEALGVLERDRLLHDELDRAFTEVRSELNLQLRPEVAEIASGLLVELTEGRYKSLEFDEDYRLLVVEDEVRKPVISGGEEDLCNLALRLAISQMIAVRAGQDFSLLILDEIFGSLDESRRANVIDLLRRLHDRFEQVIVITHIDQVQEGLDHVLQVEFDGERRMSVVKMVR